MQCIAMFLAWEVLNVLHYFCCNPCNKSIRFVNRNILKVWLFCKQEGLSLNLSIRFFFYVSNICLYIYMFLCLFYNVSMLLCSYYLMLLCMFLCSNISLFMILCALVFCFVPIVLFSNFVFNLLSVSYFYVYYYMNLVPMFHVLCSIFIPTFIAVCSYLPCSYLSLFPCSHVPCSYVPLCQCLQVPWT